MKRKKLLFLLITVSFLAVGGALAESQKSTDKKIETWEISAGRSGGIDGFSEGYSLDNEGNFKQWDDAINTIRKIDETALQKVAQLLGELNLPKAKTKMIRGKRIYDGFYSGFTITINHKKYELEGDSFEDERQVVLTPGQKQTFAGLKEELEKIGAAR